MKANGSLERLSLSIEHSEWLEAERKIPCELAGGLGVGSRGRDLAFEFIQQGHVSFRKIRREIKDESGESSKTFFIEPKGAPLCLWNEDCLSEGSGEILVITEGEFDALSFLSAGALNVVSVPNGAALDRPGQGQIIPADDNAFRYLWKDGKLKPGLARFKKIILATDGDPKGLILRDELAVRLGRPRCWYVTYPKGCKDANEVLCRHGSDALQDMIGDAKPLVPSRLVPFSQIPPRADQTQYSTGWDRLDQHFRLVPPQLIVITGRPNAGKSLFALALVSNFARLHGLRGAILQFEDNPERNRNDLIRYAESWKIPGGAAAWVDRMFRTISPNEDMDEENDFDLKWLLEAIEEAATRHGCRWIVIDPWNEVEHMWGKQDTEASYLNRALRQIKRVARRFQIAIIIVAHPTKEGGKSKIIADADLYDISGGSAWNNKADLGVVVWAEDPNQLEREIKVCKSKDFDRMGKPGLVQMRYAPATKCYTVV